MSLVNMYRKGNGEMFKHIRLFNKQFSFILFNITLEKMVLTCCLRPLFDGSSVCLHNPCHIRETHPWQSQQVSLQ